MRIQIYHIPNVKEASKYPLSNNNNTHSITKYGVLGRLDVQTVALRLVHPLKGHRWGTGQKRCPARARRANAPPYARENTFTRKARCSLRHTCILVSQNTGDLKGGKKRGREEGSREGEREGEGGRKGRRGGEGGGAGRRRAKIAPPHTPPFTVKCSASSPLQCHKTGNALRPVLQEAPQSGWMRE